MKRTFFVLITIVVVIITQNSKGQTIIPAYDSIVNGNFPLSFTQDNENIYLLYKLSYNSNYNEYKVTKFDGLHFTLLKSFILPILDDIYCIQEYKKKLYFGGNFDSFMNIPYTKGIVALFNDTFSSVGTGVNGQVNCMTIFQDNLIAGGYLSIPNGIPFHPLAKWNEGSWTNVGSIINDTNCGAGSHVSNLLPIENTLYVGGKFNKTGSIIINNIAKFENNNWYALDNGLTYGWYDFEYYNGELYVINAYPYASIYKWNGSNWSLFVQESIDDGIYCLGVYENKLFLGGYNEFNNGIVNSLAVSNGQSIQHLSFIDYYSFVTINDLINFKNKLYLTGTFSCPEYNNNYYNFGYLDSLNNLSTNEKNSKTQIQISPNPFSFFTTLHATESFKNATVLIYNSNGEKVKQMENYSGQTITLYRDNLPSGLYFIRLTEGSKVLLSDKIMIIDK